jgi:hypothetical protein
VSSRTLLLAAVHPQFGALAVIVNCPVAALPPVNVNSPGETWNVHPEAPVPAWSTVIVCVATVTVPVRRTAPWFGATVRMTVPLPFPVCPVESGFGPTVIHGTLP